jgi:hypothetical protein
VQPSDVAVPTHKPPATTVSQPQPTPILDQQTALQKISSIGVSIRAFFQPKFAEPEKFDVTYKRCYDQLAAIEEKISRAEEGINALVSASVDELQIQEQQQAVELLKVARTNLEQQLTAIFYKNFPHLREQMMQGEAGHKQALQAEILKYRERERLLSAAGKDIFGMNNLTRGNAKGNGNKDFTT